MAKKQKTIKQQANTYRNIKFACLGAEFLSAIAPFVAIGIANRDTWFINYNGTQISIALYLAFSFMGIAIYGITTKKLENTYFGFIMKWTIVAIIFTLIGELINQLCEIMWYGLIGLLGSQGFELGAKASATKQKKLLNAIEKAKEDNNIAQAKEELKH